MTDLAGAAQEFRDLAVVLRLVGEDDLRRELYRAISDASKPVLGDIRQGIPDHMPNRYAAVLSADLSLTSSARTGSDPGVLLLGRVRGSKKRKLRRLDQGILAHPLFGNRGYWYYQTPANSRGMRDGFFTRPAEDSAPQVRDAILAAMHNIAEKATRRH